MASYILKRLLLMIPTLLGVLLLTFAMVQFVPGGPVEQMVAQLQGRDSGGERAAATGAGYRGRQGVDAEQIEEIKALYGFDKPVHERFFQMLGRFARFDLGNSFYQHKDVWQLVKEKLPVSVSLGLWTFFISYLIAVPLGVAKAVRAGTRFDLVTTLIVLVGYAIPGFVLGVALLVVFGGQLQWFPLRGLTSANWETLGWGARITANEVGRNVRDNRIDSRCDLAARVSLKLQHQREKDRAANEVVEVQVRHWFRIAKRLTRRYSPRRTKQLLPSDWKSSSSTAPCDGESRQSRQLGQYERDRDSRWRNCQHGCSSGRSRAETRHCATDSPPARHIGENLADHLTGFKHARH